MAPRVLLCSALSWGLASLRVKTHFCAESGAGQRGTTGSEEQGPDRSWLRPLLGPHVAHARHVSTGRSANALSCCPAGTTAWLPGWAASSAELGHRGSQAGGWPVQAAGWAAGLAAAGHLGRLPGPAGGACRGPAPTGLQRGFPGLTWGQWPWGIRPGGLVTWWRPRVGAVGRRASRALSLPRRGRLHLFSGSVSTKPGR